MKRIFSGIMKRPFFWSYEKTFYGETSVDFKVLKSKIDTVRFDAETYRITSVTHDTISLSFIQADGSVMIIPASPIYRDETRKYTDKKYNTILLYVFIIFIILTITIYMLHPDKLNYKSSSLVLSVNGSIIKNNFFRKALKDALQFNFQEVKWVISKISPAYGAAILAAKYKNINIKLSDIISKGIEFESNSWDLFE